MNHEEEVELTYELFHIIELINSSYERISMHELSNTQLLCNSRLNIIIHNI